MMAGNMSGKSSSLFTRTALTLALTLFLLSAVILLTGVAFALFPMAQRSADDLAALLVLSAKTWTELPPVTRPDFIHELEVEHDIRLRTDITPLQPLEDWPLYVYLRQLDQALQHRLGDSGPVRLGQDPQQPDWIWIQLPTVEQPLQFGITEERVGARPPLIFVVALIAVLVFSLAAALIIARRITGPLERLSQATEAIARGRHRMLEERPDDAREVRNLIRNFNHMATEVAELLENRTTLLAGISHDLRTPLTRLRLGLEIQRDGMDPELRRLLSTNIAEMDELLEQALLLARGIDGKEPKTEQDLVAMLGALASQMEADWLRQHPDSERRLRVEIADEVGEQWFWQLPQQSCLRVLRNLIGNALRYGGEADVVLRLEQADGCPLIRVLDRGPGIPESSREAVFRPFHRLEGSRNTQTGGSGLGLAIVRQLCAALGWRVSLHGREQGGTELRLQLCDPR